MKEKRSKKLWNKTERNEKMRRKKGRSVRVQKHNYWNKKPNLKIKYRQDNQRKNLQSENRIEEIIQNTT